MAISHTIKMCTWSERLITSIKNEDLRRIQFFIDKGAQINKAVDGKTPLLHAVRTGNLAVVKLLVENAKKQIRESKSCQQSFFVKCANESINLSEGRTPEGMEALEWDMEIRDTDHNIPTPPHNCLYTWYAKILEKTSQELREDCDLDRSTSPDVAALHSAVKLGHTEITEYLLDNYSDFQLNSTTIDNETPLTCAVKRKYHRILELLLRKGASPDIRSLNTHLVPLHIAAMQGDVEAIHILLKYKANVNECDFYGQNALLFAILHRREDAARVLIRSGTSLNQEDCRGDTALCHAVDRNLPRVVEDLLDAGVTVMQSKLLLHRAIGEGFNEITRRLARAGWVVNARDEHGLTTLMVACRKRNYWMAEYLIERGVSVNATNTINDMTAMHYLVESPEDMYCIQQFLYLLLGLGADINAISHLGTPLWYAIVNGRLRLASMLIEYGADVNIHDEKTYIDTLCLSVKYNKLWIVKMIIAAGFDFRNMLFDIGTLKSRTSSEIYEFIRERMTNPMSLRDKCRVCIRRQLVGGDILGKIASLPLPTFMQDYLAMQTED